MICAARRLSVISLLALFMLSIAAACVLAATELDGLSGDYYPDELIIQLKPGNTQADAAAIATLAKAAVKRKLFGDWYWLKANNPSTTYQQMQLDIAGDSRVKFVEPNAIYRVQAIPTDTYWNLLWGMRMIDAPKAWDVVKGSANVRVSVTDSGCQLDHPELAARYLPGYDVADNDADVNPPADCARLDEGFAHGTHVAGTIAAQGNNGAGVVGVAWDNVRIIPIKMFGDDDGGLTSAALGVLALDASLIRGANVVNMSWGGSGFSQALNQKCSELATAGVILVAAAGNDNGSVGFPAGYESVIAVASVGPTGVKSSFSNFGPEIDIAAPGGEQEDGSQFDIGGVISTVVGCFGGSTNITNDYYSYQGTSMASPHVAGAAALLLSAGMPASNVRAALEGGATATGGSVPNPIYGYGILNVYNSLNFSAVTVRIDSPRQGDVVTTLKPFIRMSVLGASSSSIDIWVNGSIAVSGGSVADGRVSNYTYNTATGLLSFAYQFATTGTQTVSVTAAPASDSSRTKTATISFKLQGVTLPAGKYLFSQPFAAAGSDPSSSVGHLFYRLARAEREQTVDGVPAFVYALYNYPGLVNDSRASLQPPTVYAQEVGGSANTLPRGIGYWLELKASTTFLSNTFVDDRYPYEMDIVSGWNQIGNPFPYPIAWTNVLVTYLGETVPLTKAVEKGWISGSIYRYDGTSYRVETAPSGTLDPWRGYWVRVRVPRSNVTLTTLDDPRGILTLTFSPLQSRSSNLLNMTTAIVRKAPSTSDAMSVAASPSQRRRRPRANPLVSEFSATITAKSSAAIQSAVTLGATKTSSDALDSMDIENPPPATDAPWIAVNNSGWGADSGYYSSDYRNAANKELTWEVDVVSYDSGQISVNWSSLSALSRSYNVRVIDQTTGSLLNLNRSNYSFEAPAGASTRKFSVSLQRRFR